MSRHRAIRSLAKRVHETLDRRTDESRRMAQRRAVVAAASALWDRPGSAHWHRWALGGAAAAFLAVCAMWGIWVLTRGRGRPMRREGAPAALWIKAKGQDRPQRVGQWIQVEEDGCLVLEFEGGSTVALEGGAAGRVAEANRNRVRVQLSHGRATVAVERHGVGPWTYDTAWVVEAGPYRVAVKGTLFEVSWDLHQRALDVTVTRGRVWVTGPRVAKSGIVLVAGQKLHVNGMAGQVTWGRGGGRVDAPPVSIADPRATAEPGPGEMPPSAPADPADHAKPAKTPSDARPSTGTKPGSEGWKRLYHRGNHPAAVKAAEKYGFGQLLNTLDRSSLWALASACRYARRGKLAIRALSAVRRRFPKSGRSRTAAFLLGRVYAEFRGRQAAARRWFAVYLKENPRGPLAEEALGRYIGAAARSGHHADALRAAKQYLARYKRGVFRALAESVTRKAARRDAASASGRPRPAARQLTR